MSIDILPFSQERLASGSCNNNVCVYSMEGKCPCFQFLQSQQPQVPEPSLEVLEELNHQKEIKAINQSSHKLVYELQHAKLKLALLQLTKEIEQFTPPSYHQEDKETETVDTVEEKECELEI